MSSTSGNVCHSLAVVVCACMLGLMPGMEAHAATGKVVADQAATGNSSELKEKKLQEIYDVIDRNFNTLRTDLKLSYVENGKNSDTLSIEYKLANRNGCHIVIDNSENAMHTEKNTDTDMTKIRQRDFYCKTIDINMCNIQSITITRPQNNPYMPKIFFYNSDILNDCVYVNFNASNKGNAFNLKQNKHIHEYLNAEHHEYNKNETDDIPKEISHSFSNYSICTSDEELAGRLVRAFNDYHDICEAKGELNESR